MKSLFTYSLPLATKQDVTETLPNGDKIIKSVDKEIRIKILIKEPTRINIQDARDVYNKEWSRCVTNGIVTRAMLDKKYRSEKGIFTDDEIKGLNELDKRIKEIRAEYAEIDIKKEKTEEDNKKIEKLVNEFAEIQSRLEDLENINENLYSGTAESLAKQKEILYNLLFLSYIEKDGDFVPLVDGDTLEDRLEQYDEILDKNDDKSKLYGKIVDRNGYFINLLSRGKIQTSQLEELNKRLDEAEKPATDSAKEEILSKAEVPVEVIKD